MNLTLGQGKTVHAGSRVEGRPLCGARSDSDFGPAAGPVTCKRCIKQKTQRDEYAARNAYYAQVAEGQDGIMSQAKKANDALPMREADDRVAKAVALRTYKVDGGTVTRTGSWTAAVTVGDTVVGMKVNRHGMWVAEIPGRGTLATRMMSVRNAGRLVASKVVEMQQEADSVPAQEADGRVAKAVALLSTFHDDSANLGDALTMLNELRDVLAGKEADGTRQLWDARKTYDHNA